MGGVDHFTRSVVGCLTALLAAGSLVVLMDVEPSSSSTGQPFAPGMTTRRPQTVPLLPASTATTVSRNDLAVRRKEDPSTAVDRAVPVRLVLYLETSPLARTRIRVGRHDVITDAAGHATVVLEPGVHRVSAPDLHDAEACLAQAWWLRREAAIHGEIFRRGGPDPQQAGALIRVCSDDEEFDDDGDPCIVEVDDRPGLVLVRFLAPWLATGDVVDAESGASIPGATIEVADVRAVTDTAGSFRLAVPGDRDQDPPVLSISAPGYGGMATRVRAERVRIPLRRALSLAGRVFDLRGNPLPATVEAGWCLPDPVTGDVIDDMRWTEVSCGPDGRFQVDAIALGARAASYSNAGPYAAMVHLIVRSPGHVHEEVRVVVTPDAAPVEVRLDRSLSVVGRVVGVDGRPIAGADVNSTECEQIETDAAGRFQIEGIPERARFSVRAAGLPPQRFQAWLPVADELVLRLLDPSVHHGSIQGRVLDSEGGSVPGVLVRASEPNTTEQRASFAPTREGEVARVGFDEDGRGVARTNDAGVFALVGLPAGERFDLAVTTPERPLANASGVPVGTTGLTLVVNRAAILRPGKVRLRVEAADDAPLSVVIEHADGRQSHLTYSHGRARGIEERTTWLEPGQHTLVARAPGHLPGGLPFEVRAGADMTLAPLRLSPGGGAVALHVRWPRRPVKSLRVTIRDLETGLELEEWPEIPSAPDVPVTIHCVDPCRATLSLVVYGHDDDDQTLSPRTITIRDGLTEIVEVDLR